MHHHQRQRRRQRHWTRPSEATPSGYQRMQRKQQPQRRRSLPLATPRAHCQRRMRRLQKQQRSHLQHHRARGAWRGRVTTTVACSDLLQAPSTAWAIMCSDLTKQ
jgi:hypothetical protein